MKALVTFNGVNKFVSYDTYQTLLQKAQLAFNVSVPCALEYYDAEYKLDVRVEDDEIPTGVRLKLVPCEVPSNETESVASDATL